MTHVRAAGTTCSSDGEWIFFPMLESGGNDIEFKPELGGTDNFAVQRKHADDFPGQQCVAFNTDGWFKSKVMPRLRWTNHGPDSAHGMWVRRRTLRALEWVFFPGKESPGSDLQFAAEFAGNCTHMKYYVEMEFPDALAFNTTGFIKKGVLAMDQWVDSPGLKQGLWVKASALDALDWVFVQGMDSAGNDIKKAEANGADALRLEAVAQRERCVAYNTYGWLKYNLLPRASWRRWTEKEGEGMWVKRGALERLGWSFVPFMDSHGNDLMREGDLRGDTAGLFSFALNLPDCVAFNTNGWMKNALLPQSEWKKWSKSPIQGMYVRDDQPELLAWKQNHP